ncbi:MAG: hypothetical protein OHK0040_13730 [bacterium]
MNNNTPKILVVDDNEYGRYATKKILQQAGFNVVEADCGKTALELAKQNPSLILLDINLLDISGFDVCKIIKSNEETQDIPIIFLTAHYLKIEDKVTGLEMGADNYLSQPVEPAELVATVKAMLRLRSIEEELKEKEKLYKSLYTEFNAVLDAIPDNIILLDKELRLVWVNDAVEKKTGKSIEEIKGRHCFEAIYGLAIPCTDCPSLTALKSAKLEEGTIKTPDNLIFDLRSVPIKDSAGNVINIVEVGRDVTEHRKLEEQLRQTQKLESIGQFAGGIAHDFNNILSAVLGFSELLKMSLDENDPKRHFVDQIISSTQRGADLTRQILAFGRKQILDIKPVNLNELITSLSGMLRRILREDVSLQLNLSEENLVIMADAIQIDQVLLNLTANARDAMPDGGTLVIKTEKLTIDENFIKYHGYGGIGDYGKITVSDTGCGMSKEVLERIFEPFFTTKEQGKGTGLGLSVVYGIIKQHKGFINCYSELGKGTTFTIYLPLAKIDTTGERIIKEEKIVPAKAGETIFLIEDDRYAREALTEFFNAGGYQVISAEDGNQAIEIFKEKFAEIDIALIDAILPKKSGKEVFDEIKKIKPDIKALFMSGYTADIIHEKGILDTSFDFIQKPASPIEIMKKVREILDRK